MNNIIKQMNNITKQKQTHRYREKNSGYQWEKGRGKGNIGVRD